MRVHLSIAAILVGTACSQSAPSAILTSPDDLPSLRAADSAWKQASLSRNVDRMVGFYTSNAIADLGLGEPSRGAAAIRELWTAAYADTAYRLDWTNQRAEVAAGTALGYTIGTWRLHATGIDSTGPYFAVWQKQTDGRWLVLLDMAR